MYRIVLVVLVSVLVLGESDASAQIIRGSGGSGGSAPTLDNVLANGREATTLNSQDNAIKLGNNTSKLNGWWDPTLGWIWKPNPLGDSLWRIWPNFNGCIRDEEADANVLCFDPDASAAKDKYPFQPGYYPLKSFWIGAVSTYGDGTNCPERPTAVTINSGPKIPTFICTDNDASRLTFALRMPNDWDGGTVTLTQVIIQTAADTSAISGAAAMQCRGSSETVSNTWGTEVTLSLANVSGSNKNDLIASAAITPAGTCSAGDMLYGYWRMNATGTTTAVATLHSLGFHLTYSSTSLSH